MKGLVVFDTSHGNTRSIAETISGALIKSGIGVDTMYVKNVKKVNGQDYDFLVLGSPTKFGTMSFTFKAFLNKIKAGEWKNKAFAAFDTENPENIERARLENKEWSAAEKIATKLKEKQMKQLLPVLKSVVLGWKGPLEAGEIERAREYAGKLAVELGR